MTTPTNNQICEIVARKALTGEPWDNDEKAHLAVCEACMSQVVRMLDEAAMGEATDRDTGAGPTTGILTQARPEASQALELGRRVFQREFGISLSGELSHG